MASTPEPSPDGAVSGSGAAPRKVEVARLGLKPPEALAASPRPLLARLLLTRLHPALEAAGWTVERRYDQPLVMLRVYSSDAPCFGDSITVVHGDGGWWFRSSTGELLAQCGRVDLAVSAVSALLRAVAAASEGRSPGGM